MNQVLNKTSNPEKTTALLGIFLLCAGSLVYELALIRLFSVIMWYHFASLGIGLALLGLGAGGLAKGLWPSFGGVSTARNHSLLFGLGALSILFFLCAVNYLPDLALTTLAPFHQPFYKPFDRPEASVQEYSMAARLLILSVGVGWPFFFVGTAISGLLAESAPRINRTYAATFIGSAAGTAIFAVLMNFLGAPAALAIGASLGVLAAGFFSGTGISRWLLFVISAAVLALGFWINASGAAEIPFARGRFEPNLLSVAWNPMSRVAAYPLPPGDTARTYGQSPYYRGEVPAQIGLVVDDSGYTNIFDGESLKSNPEYYRANIAAIPHRLRPGAESLLFGTGGGKDILIALAFPNAKVTAVEINPLVVEMVEERFAAFTGKPYSNPAVRTVIADARRFAATDRGEYDIIGASAVFGRMPPAAGAFTLSEDSLHTLEGFRNYWDRLSDRGILSITRFAYEQRALRLASLARALIDSEGIKEPGRHIRIVSDRGLINIMLCRNPYSDEDDRILAAEVERYGFEILYPPPDASQANALTRIVDEPDLAAALAAIEFDVSPPTDDRPFFYYTVRPADFLRGSLPGRAGFDDRGAEVLRTSFLILASLALIVLILPTWAAKGLPRSRSLIAPFLLFAAIGLAYLILEIGIMKRLYLLLGHPMYAVASTLTLFLLGSGAGSICSAKLADSRYRLTFWASVAGLLGFLHAFFGSDLFEHFLSSSVVVRYLIAALAVLPLAFVAGIIFPAAIARLGKNSGPMLPWIWAINGAASVTASLGTILIAMNMGYTTAINVGATLYLFAAACSVLIKDNQT